jgi:hypothetical protein
MRVTEDMKTGSGAALILLADFLDEDGAGVRATVTDAGNVKFAIDSTAYPCQAVHLNPDDADDLAQLIHLRAAEARARS